MRWMKSCRKAARQVSRRRSALLLIFLLSVARAPTQETTLRSRSNLVLLPTLVRDSQGAIVYGIEAKDFMVEDDGVEQPVRLAHPGLHRVRVRQKNPSNGTVLARTSYWAEAPEKQ